MQYDASAALTMAMADVQQFVGLGSAAPDCAAFGQGLAAQLSSDTRVNFAEPVTKGQHLDIPLYHPSCLTFAEDIDFDFCRVGLTTTTGPTSAVTSEVWLPANWTGRVLAVGNNGLGGCFAHEDLLYGAGRGFAAVATDNGHAGDTGVPLEDDGVLEDYAWRAVHSSAVLIKEAVKAYYGTEHTKAYYIGCSTGGRQGFMTAQEFPENFDGIVAGAPAFSLSGLQTWSGYATTYTGPPGSPTFLTPEHWAAVIKDVMRQCDGLDGHEDGILEHTDLCHYRPEALLCGTNPDPAEVCLTGLQAETVRSIYSPIIDAEGNLVYPRMQPGQDSSDALWMGTMEGIYVLDWFRHVVYRDASWAGPPNREDIEANKARGAAVRGLEGWKGDLSASRDRGVKILHYHGLQDPVISSDNSARYYDFVARTMGIPYGEIDDFYRLFTISGMSHCHGGTGAFNIGNKLRNLATEEPEGNTLAAMVRWVEEGVAPDTILGTAYATEARDEIAFQRRHCKYPLRNMYKGAGDPNSADSWHCV